LVKTVSRAGTRKMGFGWSRKVKGPVVTRCHNGFPRAISRVVKVYPLQLY